MEISKAYHDESISDPHVSANQNGYWDFVGGVPGPLGLIEAIEGPLGEFLSVFDLSGEEGVVDVVVPMPRGTSPRSPQGPCRGPFPLFPGWMTSHADNPPIPLPLRAFRDIPLKVGIEDYGFRDKVRQLYRCGRKMFIVTLKYLKPLNEVEKFLEAHRSFLGKYYDSNDLVCSGPKNPRDGGIIIARTKERAMLEKILAEDPFQKNQIATYEIVEFTPAKFSKAFEDCL